MEPRPFVKTPFAVFVVAHTLPEGVALEGWFTTPEGVQPALAGEPGDHLYLGESVWNHALDEARKEILHRDPDFGSLTYGEMEEAWSNVQGTPSTFDELPQFLRHEEARGADSDTFYVFA